MADNKNQVTKNEKARDKEKIFTTAIVTETITIAALTAMAQGQHQSLVKAVVDVVRNIMAIGGEMHYDEEQVLLDDGSVQKDLWGINLHPERFGGSDFIEFDSMINLRPGQGNSSRSVVDPANRTLIVAVVGGLVTA